MRRVAVLGMRVLGGVAGRLAVRLRGPSTDFEDLACLSNEELDGLV
jgi:hypothetical protein